MLGIDAWPTSGKALIDRVENVTDFGMTNAATPEDAAEFARSLTSLFAAQLGADPTPS
jgi:hypothetical protein